MVQIKSLIQLWTGSKITSYLHFSSSLCLTKSENRIFQDFSDSTQVFRPCATALSSSAYRFSWSSSWCRCTLIGPTCVKFNKLHMFWKGTETEMCQHRSEDGHNKSAALTVPKNTMTSIIPKQGKLGKLSRAGCLVKLSNLNWMVWALSECTVQAETFQKVHLFINLSFLQVSK